MTSVRAQADLFGRAARAVADLVGTIPAGSWDEPGLGEWDLRALVGHTSRSLLTVEAYLGQPAEREDLTSPENYLATAIASVDPASIVQRGRDAGAALGSDPAASFSAIVARVLPLLDREDDPLIRTIAGGMRLSTYLQTRTFELVVHGLDIADALGVGPPAFAPEVWEVGLGLAVRSALVKGWGPDLLRAVTGRAGLPEGFSVV
jgi:uncharacterized protein (TIGR03083 family)